MWPRVNHRRTSAAQFELLHCDGAFSWLFVQLDCFQLWSIFSCYWDLLASFGCFAAWFLVGLISYDNFGLSVAFLVWILRRQNSSIYHSACTVHLDLSSTFCPLGQSWIGFAFVGSTILTIPKAVALNWGTWTFGRVVPSQWAYQTMRPPVSKHRSPNKFSDSLLRALCTSKLSFPFQWSNCNSYSLVTEALFSFAASISELTVRKSQSCHLQLYLGTTKTVWWMICLIFARAKFSSNDHRFDSLPRPELFMKHQVALVSWILESKTSCSTNTACCCWWPSFRSNR